jgi:hypothetical protein
MVACGSQQSVALSEEGDIFLLANRAQRQKTPVTKLKVPSGMQISKITCAGPRAAFITGVRVVARLPMDLRRAVFASPPDFCDIELIFPQTFTLRAHRIFLCRSPVLHSLINSQQCQGVRCDISLISSVLIRNIRASVIQKKGKSL